MKCQLKYHWVKLPRACLPQGKGVLGQWARLAARAAYRKGVGIYCGFKNPVEPGMWAGGVVGLKSILGAKSRTAALESLERLQTLGYVSYSLDRRTKKLVYTVLDRVVTCTGEACLGQGVYAYEGQGFLCVPRTLPDRLAKRHYIFEEADALLDLWCHTVWQEPRNIFSHLAPAIQYGSMATVLTLETLGKRWGWEKTKVWRFFKKHEDAFPLYRLPGSYGCLVFNAQYPTKRSVDGRKFALPTQDEIMRIIEKLRFNAGNTQISGADNARLNKMTLWYSTQLLNQEQRSFCREHLPSNMVLLQSDCEEGIHRVALSTPLLRAYLSPCWNSKNYEDDCEENRLDLEPVFSFHEIPALFDFERKVSHEKEREEFPELYEPISGFDRSADHSGTFGGQFHSR